MSQQLGYTEIFSEVYVSLGILPDTMLAARVSWVADSALLTWSDSLIPEKACCLNLAIPDNRCSDISDMSI